MKNINKLFLVLSVLLCSCSIPIPNTRVCTASGWVLNGADCAYTLSDKVEHIEFNEFMDFLEPKDEQPDLEHPDRVIPARGGALCQSAEDWNAQKTALEKLCRKYKGACNYQIQKAVERVNRLVARGR